jgi:hypothetical protein
MFYGISVNCKREWRERKLSKCERAWNGLILLCIQRAVDFDERKILPRTPVGFEDGKFGFFCEVWMLVLGFKSGVKFGLISEEFRKNLIQIFQFIKFLRISQHKIEPKINLKINSAKFFERATR